MHTERILAIGLVFAGLAWAAPPRNESDLTREERIEFKEAKLSLAAARREIISKLKCERCAGRGTMDVARASNAYGRPTTETIQVACDQCGGDGMNIDDDLHRRLADYYVLRDDLQSRWDGLKIEGTPTLAMWLTRRVTKTITAEKFNEYWLNPANVREKSAFVLAVEAVGFYEHKRCGFTIVVANPLVEGQPKDSGSLMLIFRDGAPAEVTRLLQRGRNPRIITVAYNAGVSEYVDWFRGWREAIKKDVGENVDAREVAGDAAVWDRCLRFADDTAHLGQCLQALAAKPLGTATLRRR